MVHVGRPLITSHYTGAEFTGKSVLNVGITIEDVNTRILKPAKKMVYVERKVKLRRENPLNFDLNVTCFANMVLADNVI